MTPEQHADRIIAEAYKNPLPIGKLEPFTPREPDWKQLYYALALRCVAANICADKNDPEAVKTALDKANEIIESTEEKIKIGNAIVSVQTSES